MLDLATKRLAERHLNDPVSLIGGAQLELGHNSGVAFGALDALPAGALVAGASCLVLALVIASGRGIIPVPTPAIGLLAGGAMANLLDRAHDGRVTDFIELPRWPTFNVADIAIIADILLIAWHASRADDSGAQAGTSAAQAGQGEAQGVPRS